MQNSDVDQLSNNVFGLKMQISEVDQSALWTWVDQLSFSMSWLSDGISKCVGGCFYLLSLSLSQPALLTHIFIFLFVLFFKREFLYGFGACPGTSSLDQAGLELTEIRLPLPPKCWN